MLFQTYMTFFLLQNAKEGILKNVSNQTVLAIDEEKHSDISQNIFFRVPQKKVSHTGE